MLNIKTVRQTIYVRQMFRYVRQRLERYYVKYTINTHDVGTMLWPGRAPSSSPTSLPSPPPTRGLTNAITTVTTITTIISMNIIVITIIIVSSIILIVSYDCYLLLRGCSSSTR